ncbi:serine/threonine protein kinase [Nonomuraea indica]|uniref:serine/threonine protein kinase n=1 Tax=Nonomuraea indica TaxID=1581193 RepID=UPI0015DF5124|nr:serine/threonine protein kinase [Nonomuraea indica]
MFAPRPEDPRAIGPYRIDGRIGAGGQGTVYAGRAADGVLVAVKLLHPHLVSDDRARARFLSEVETAKRVAPFCTAQILDSGYAGRSPYIVSEFVNGPSLQESVRESGPRGAAALQRLAINTATALAAIHAGGVVHRDFKPGNVLLGPDGPVVIDFGISRALDLSQSVVTSQPIGSPAYMAPEQVAGEHVGPAADMFAWAATMIYAATGRLAFGGDSIPAILQLILRGEPDLGHVESRLRRVLRECLAKEPARRPSAAQVVERLRALPAPSWQAVPAGSTRRARVLGVSSASVALLTLTAIGYHLTTPGTPSQSATSPQPITATSAVASTFTAAGSPSPDAARPGSITRTAASEKTGRVRTDAPSPPPASRRSASPTRRAEPTTSSRSPRTPETTTREPTTRSPSPVRQSTSRPAVEPSTGTVTWSDAHAYCKAQGHFMAGGTWNAMRCQGSDVAVTPTTLCRWKYPGYANAVGEQPPSGYSQQATCRLS